MNTTKSIYLTICLFLAIFLWSCGQTSNQTSSQNPDQAHSSRVSLDWSGTYYGVLPCADCEGIATTIHINEDETFEIHMKYLGKDDNNTFVNNGHFEWDEAGNIITLEGIEYGANHYQVGENSLIQLDINKNRITGELADMYVLGKKVLSSEEVLLHGIYWKLIEVGGIAIDGTKENLKQAHLKLDFYKMRAYGAGGCNNFFGEIEMPSSGKLKFNRMASTMMACPDMETDKLLFSAFENTDSYSVSEGILTIAGGARSLAVFKAIEE